MELNGKSAIVTGASSGIGAATAIKLAREGVKVGLAARRRDRLQALVSEIKAFGGEAIALEMDVTDQASVFDGVKKLHDAYGHIDIAFNNAGLMPISDIASLKLEEWHRMVDVNIKGLMNTVAAVLPVMQAQKSGHIINTFAGLGVYCATKHAAAAFSDVLRMELSSQYNIRVTSLQPGAVESELFEHITDENYRAQMENLKEHMTFLKSEDIADSILYVLRAPDHVDVAELFIMPTEQQW